MPQFGIKYAEGMKVLPVLAPIDIAANATNGAYVDIRRLNWLTFLVPFGVITSTDSTGECVVTVETNAVNDTSSSDSVEVAGIAFNYRLSAAVGTDSMGAITAATASGVAFANTSDGKMLVIDVDPAVVQATSGQRYVRLVFTPTAESTVGLVGAVAVCEARYPGNAIPSST
jgi:hypothetical protein